MVIFSSDKLTCFLDCSLETLLSSINLISEFDRKEKEKKNQPNNRKQYKNAPVA